MKKITIGLASIKLGAIAVDGGMGTSLATLGFTSQGTCKINFEDAEKKEFFVEEFDEPAHIEYTQGKISIVFEIADPDLDTVAKVFGGTATGTAGSKTYKAPLQFTAIEQSLEITPKKGIGFKFARVSISPKFTSDLGKESLLALEITCDVLRPTKATEPRFEMFEVK